MSEPPSSSSSAAAAAVTADSTSLGYNGQALTADEDGANLPDSNANSEPAERLTQASPTVYERASPPPQAAIASPNAIPQGQQQPSTPLSRPSYTVHERRTSKNQGLSIQPISNSPNRPALTLSPLANTLPDDQIYNSQHITSANHLSPIPASALSPMSSYFGRLHGSQSFDNSDSYSSASALPSPALSAMIDITPLPSPIYLGSGTPQRSNSHSRKVSRGLGYRPLDDRITRSNSVNSRKKKGYGSLLGAAVEASATNAAAGTSEQKSHGRNRSISDFVPEALTNVRQRVATFGPMGANGDNARPDSGGSQMHREEYLAGRRGLTQKGGDASTTFPSPPPSMRSETGDDDDEDAGPDQPGVEYFRSSTNGPEGSRKRKWRSLKMIGTGTFSKVYLATSQRLAPGAVVDEKALDPAKLVAVKICEHGPAGGADEERVKHSLDREIEILKTISHPCIVRLKALEEKPGRTEMVMTYCTGGDLFEFASEKRDLLRIELVQRMFAELVAATSYLHKNLIVHRDIKLENVLVNTPAHLLTASALADPFTHPFPLITLTDLGLSRRIPAPPASPLLTTRCGSEDYAAPELLLGQPYDGRLTDSWALGVLLYALVEGRLPFDAPPGKIDRSKNTHRIARCDWIWSRMGDEDGEWDSDRGNGWEGAREVVEGCLRKVRMGRKTVDDLKVMGFVRDGVKVEGGLRRREDDGGWMRSPEF